MPERKPSGGRGAPPFPSGGWLDIGAEEDFPEGAVRRVEVRGCVLAVVRHLGIVRALEAVCPHQGGPLAEGVIWRGQLECPWHHFRYDPASGANTFPANVYPEDLPALRPQLSPVRVYPVVEEKRRVKVSLDRETV